MQVPVHNLKGEVVSQAELSDLVFGIEPNESVMHQAMVRQLANARLGTHNTRSRGQVSGGGRKPYRQKGTGHARQGSIRAPQFRSGGVVFGPHPRSYRQRMPRKMRRLAIRSALSQKAREQALGIVEGLDSIEPRTKAMIEAMKALQVDGGTVLIATHGRCEPIERASGNVPTVKLVHASNLGVADMLKYDYLLLDARAVQPLEENLLKGASKKYREAEAAAQGEDTGGEAS